MKKMKEKREKGITLIALIVTIVVLIILATISILAVFGENGIIARAQEAKRMHEEGKCTEENRLDDYTKYIENYMKNEEQGKDNTIDEDGEDDEEDPEWKKITVEERWEKLKNLDARLEVFNKDVVGTTNDINKNTWKKDSDGNYIYEKSSITDEAKCECGKIKEIYDKAKEMGLVKTYDDMEKSRVTATIKEASLVLFDFYCLNAEQKPGGVIPMAKSLNYEINPNSKEWFDGNKVSFADDSGEYENMLAWVNNDYAKNGFVMMSAIATMHPDVSIEQLGQVTHMKIEVLSQTNFRKAMKALNLDLSAYEGKCTHPTK